MALRELFAAFGFSYDKAKLREINTQVDGVKSNIKGAGKGFSEFAEGIKGALTALTAGLFVEFTNHIKEQAAELQDLTEQTGLSTDELQAWTLEAQLGGASAQDFTNGLRKLSKELATGVDESGQQSKLFKHLGIQTKDTAGNVRELSDVLPEIAEKFKGLKTGAEKSALAQQIFGRAGTKLVPILSQGAEGVAKMREQFEALGGGFSKEAIQRADEYDDALTKLNFSFFGFKSLIATSVFPVLTNLVGSITKGAVSFTNWIKQTTALGTGVKVLAGLIGGKLLMALAPFLLPGLKFLAIFLAVDDLIGFLQGKDSLIGTILNSWFGDGTATAVRKWCNDAGEVIKSVLIGSLDLLKIAFASTDAESEAAWDHFYKATRPVSDALDSIFDKLKAIKDAFTDWDVIKTGLNDLLDVATDPFDSEEEKQRKAKESVKRHQKLNYGIDEDDPSLQAKYKGSDKSEDLGAVVRDLYGSVRGNPQFAGMAEDYFSPDKDRRGQGPRAYAQKATVPTAAQAIYNYDMPVSVNQEIKAKVDAQAIKDAAKQGVAAGINEYRSALENLEQRSGAK